MMGLLYVFKLFFFASQPKSKSIEKKRKALIRNVFGQDLSIKEKLIFKEIMAKRSEGR
tara:strand:- start:998 stop:1171 length:174 start_codon:yes stop_codon:yes gene_type:complete